MSQYFLESYERSRGNVKVELDISSSVTKVDLKGEIGIDISTLAPERDLACLEIKLEKLDADKL